MDFFLSKSLGQDQILISSEVEYEIKSRLKTFPHDKAESVARKDAKRGLIPRDQACRIQWPHTAQCALLIVALRPMALRWFNRIFSILLSYLTTAVPGIRAAHISLPSICYSGRVMIC